MVVFFANECRDIIPIAIEDASLSLTPGSSLDHTNFHHYPHPRIAMSSLVSIVLVLIIIGVLLGLINRFIPMAQSIKTILNVVVIIAVIVWLLQIFGVIHGLDNIFNHY